MAGDSSGGGARPRDGDPNPIVVVGCGFRCGSTLLQRILCGAPQTMVWGESNDALPAVLDAYVRIGFWTGMSMKQRDGFESEGAGAWIANLQPPLERTAEATAAWIRTRYARQLDGAPAERWGLKDLRLEPQHLSTLWTALPSARVIFMLRHPRPLLASMIGTGWFRATPPEAIVRTWVERVEWAYRSTDPRLMIVRYDALCADPRATLDAVADHLLMARAALDAEIARVVVRGTDAPPVLDAAAEAALASPALQAALERVGYVGGNPARL